MKRESSESKMKLARTLLGISDVSEPVNSNDLVEPKELADLIRQMIYSIAGDVAKSRAIKIEMNTAVIEEIAALVEVASKRTTTSTDGQLSIVKVAAIYTFWINRLKPFQQVSTKPVFQKITNSLGSMEDKEVDNFKFLNEFIALQAGLEILEKADQEDRSNMEFNDELLHETMYSLRYNNHSVDSVYWMLKSLYK